MVPPQEKERNRRDIVDAAVACAAQALPEKQYFNTPAAGAYLSVTRKQLEHWRSLGCGPVFIKLGRHVRYARTDLDAWMSERRVSSTAEGAQVR